MEAEDTRHRNGKRRENSKAVEDRNRKSYGSNTTEISESKKNCPRGKTWVKKINNIPRLSKVKLQSTGDKRFEK